MRRDDTHLAQIEVAMKETAAPIELYELENVVKKDPKISWADDEVIIAKTELQM